MNIGRPWTIWSQSPTAAAQRLELACWVATAGLVLALSIALALASVSGPHTGASAQASGITAAAPAPHFTIYQQHCIERILTRPSSRTEDAVTHLIDQLCFAPFRSHGSVRTGVPSCDQLLTTWFVPRVKPVTGCLVG